MKTFKYTDYNLLKEFQHMTTPVKHYRSDIYDYDFPKIMNTILNKDIINYLYIIRESGTFMITIPGSISEMKTIHEYNDLHAAIACNWPSRIEYILRFNKDHVTISDPEIYG